jgi:hypothetical protein
MMDSILGSAQEETAVLAGRRFQATQAHQDGVTRKLQQFGYDRSPSVASAPPVDTKPGRSHYVTIQENRSAEARYLR